MHVRIGVISTIEPMSLKLRISELATKHLGKRFLLYALVSGVATLITQVLLAVLHSFAGWRASVANLVAVGVATPVSYYMNRALVWRKRGKSHFGKEVAPFWAFSIAGLLLSTFLVGLVAFFQKVPVGTKPTVVQQLQINLANAIGFGILWLIQFFVLDKISFKTHHLPLIPPVLEEDEIAYDEASQEDDASDRSVEA